MDKFERNSIIAVSVICLSVIVGAILTGNSFGTFGSRCVKVFPEDAIKQEICVERLNAGQSFEDMYNDLKENETE